MFKRILIANRGEIACRIIKTARKMGIATVAVYSDADRDALHVEMADEAVHIGPPAATESYLQIDKIVAACKATGFECMSRIGRVDGGIEIGARGPKARLCLPLSPFLFRQLMLRSTMDRLLGDDVRRFLTPFVRAWVGVFTRRAPA